jgi:hypothetical protein
VSCRSSSASATITTPRLYCRAELSHCEALKSFTARGIVRVALLQQCVGVPFCRPTRHTRQRYHGRHRSLHLRRAGTQCPYSSAARHHPPRRPPSGPCVSPRGVHPRRPWLLPGSGFPTASDDAQVCGRLRPSPQSAALDCAIASEPKLQKPTSTSTPLSTSVPLPPLHAF